MNNLLAPRLIALRREGGTTGRARLLILGVLGALLWVVTYSIMVRILGHFMEVDPELGRILSVKLIAMLMLFLLSFLTFSSLISAVSLCFLATDLPLWVTSPIPLRRLFKVKLVEVSTFASWTALFLVLPVWVAYGTVFDAGPAFYVGILATVAPVVIFTASIGILIAVSLVNLFPARRARDLLSLFALLFVAGLMIVLRTVRPEQFVRPEDFGTWAEYLVSLSSPTLPWLPSYWAARIQAETLGLYVTGFHADVVVTYMALLWGVAAVTTLAAAGVFRHAFRAGFSKALEARQVRLTRNAWWRGAVGIAARPFPRRVRAIVVKDVSTFFRDPAQWSQLFLLMAVVVVYLYNFHVLPLDPAGGTGYFMRNLLAFLNVALVGLVMTALAARFVLPGVSLEGRTMWLLQSSPLTSWELLMAKFWGGFVPLVVIAELLIVTSNALLHTTTLLSILSAVSVFFLAIAISGMAVGLGASHPRYDVADGAQVATGYAGFLLMVISALLILVSVTVLAWPLYHSFRATWLGSGVGMRDWIGLAGGLSAVGAMSIIAMAVALKRGVRGLELQRE